MICKCCKNEYHDSFVSCPFCGTATALNTSGEVESCPKCGACVIKNQPMCQFCGFENPARTLADNAKADNNGASFSGDYYNNQQKYPPQNTSANYPQFMGESNNRQSTTGADKSKIIRLLALLGVYTSIALPFFSVILLSAATVMAVKYKNKSSIVLLIAGFIFLIMASIAN